MDALPLVEILNLGTSGLTFLLVYSLIKSNERLLSEIKQFNDLLLDIINRLLEIEDQRKMTRRGEDRREL